MDQQHLRKPFLGSVRYWIAHVDHFDALFANSPEKPFVSTVDGLPCGQSATVLRSLTLYRYLSTMPSNPVPTRRRPERTA